MNNYIHEQFTMKRNVNNEKEDNFMKKFKYYKSNNPKPSLELVLTTQNNYFEEETNFINKITEDDPRAEMLGLISLQNWKVYRFKKHPGLILIRNPFTSLGQRYWIQKSLKEYPKKPNKTNIDIERYIDDWWAESHLNDKCDTKLQKKLRWTTLGYHHNWDTKIYAEENKNLFPDDLAELCDIFANYLGYKSFKAQAAIVNYYHMGSTLSAHTDHSEVNLEAPLFSFSFGQSAIFLIGGHDKASDPTAILLNSGDVIIMSQEARLCYHAVPKILPAPSQPWDSIEKLSYVNSGIQFKYLPKELDINETIDKIWTEFGRYIKESRININVRQVLKENQTNLNDVNNI